MNQHEFVQNCLLKYEVTPKPQEEVWEEAHYPVPKCLGGFTTIQLWRSDHAIQGLLQSEEYNHPCIWGWELKYLPEEFLELFHKWMSELSKLAAKYSNSSRSPEDRVKLARKASQAAREKFLLLSEEEKSAWGKRASLAAFEAMTSEQRSSRSKKAGLASQSKRTTEQTKTWCGKGAESQHKIRVRCLVTGYVSTPCGLSSYQKSRGIDTSLRERVQKEQND